VIDNRRRKGRNSSMRDQVKKRAIVTGASSGIGKEISGVLVEMGYEVYGFGRSFSDEEPDQIDTKRDLTGKICTENGTDAQNEEKGMLHRIVCDLLDTQELERQIKQIRRQGGVQLLVNNAGVGYYGLHEELNTQKIQKLVRTNLEVPMVLTSLLLRDLKKCAGTIINISSVTAQLNNPHGCAYGATKAGLSSFSRSLFDEVRKYGVRVVTIQPDMTKTELYRNADFAQGEEEASYLLPEEIAETVRDILYMREGAVVTEITLRPQLHRIRRK
jgi:short-subunit dehydrogenase